MEMTRRGFLKFLSALPIAVAAAKAEAVAQIIPLVHDPRFEDDAKQDFYDGYFDYELRFEDMSIGIYHLSTNYEVPEVWVSPIKTLYRPEYTSITMNASSFCGKSYPRVHKFMMDWIETVCSFKGKPNKQAKLVRHMKTESFVVADLDILYPRETQIRFDQDTPILDLSFEVSTVKIYSENLERCQNTMV